MSNKYEEIDNEATIEKVKTNTNTTIQQKEDNTKKNNWKKVISITLNEEEIEKLNNFIKEFNKNGVLKINRSIAIRELIKQKHEETKFK